MPKEKIEAALPSLPRNIYFYRLDTDAGPTGEQPDLDLTGALNAVDALDFESQERYLVIENENALACWIDVKEGPILKMRFGLTRRNGLPKVDKDGLLSEIKIAQHAGLAEQIHVVFFPNKIVGSEFNFYGPRIGKLTTYFKDKIPAFPVLYFNPLVNKNIISKIDKMTEVKFMTIKVTKTFAERMAEFDESLISKLNQLRGIGGSENIEITIGTNKRNRFLDLGWIKDFGKRMLRFGVKKEEIPKFKIKAMSQDGHDFDTLDMLSDKLVLSKNINTSGQKSRSLDLDSAYAAIEEAYGELKNELENSWSASHDRH